MRNIDNKPKDNTARLYSFNQFGTAAAPLAPVAGVVDILAAHVGDTNEHLIYIGQTVAPTTVNLSAAAKAKLQSGDKVILVIPTDATGRTVTWGTNIKSSAATLAIVANGKTVVIGIYDGTDLVIR
jgi:hypothetical protein